jgi:hypothetical protein
MMKLNSTCGLKFFCVEAGHCLEVWGGLGLMANKKGELYTWL